MLQLNGLVNRALRGAGLGGLAFDWLGQPGWALWTMTGVIVWKELGFGVILFLARLLSLPAETFEAARIDGARFFRLHRYVTVPQLGERDRVLRRRRGDHDGLLGLQLRLRDLAGTGGPGDATQVTELYIYQTAFQYSAPDLAAAAAVILFGATLVFIVVFFRIQRRAGLFGGNE